LDVQDLLPSGPCSSAPHCFNCEDDYCHELFRCDDGSFIELPNCEFYDPSFDTVEDFEDSFYEEEDLSYFDFLHLIQMGEILSEEDFEDFEESDWLDIIPEVDIELCDIPHCLPCPEPCLSQPTTWCGDWQIPVRICLDVDERL